MNLQLEVVLIPVSDVDRAKDFYVTSLGCRLDADFSAGDDFRVVQVTPPGSPGSIIFGTGVAAAAPGSIESLMVIVEDVVAARAELVSRGVDVSEVFHDAGGVFHHAGTQDRVAGPDPKRRSYCSFASFTDPDGNGWLMQEITQRLPGRVEVPALSFSTPEELSHAFERAAAAHGQHEQEIGAADPNWPIWYAQFLFRERSGASA